ncbi:MAG: LysM peptidoglycan-binding domain-containing protein [Lachnospiraceae bacterium]|nr:LysM peptidoglycan-binding domain-containing protein [Lachnospiraceae bacterium]
MGLRLRSVKKTGALFLSAAVLMSALPCLEVFAAEQYPLVYDDMYAKDENYMALTEGSEDYVVLPGDSLWKIAEELFGDGNAYAVLANTNRDVVTNPDLIYPGMRLNVSRTGYIHRKEAVYGGIQMGSYSMDMPHGWAVGTTQSGGAGGNFVMSGDGTVACLIQDRTKEVSTDVLDWQKCTEQIAAYAEEHYRDQVTDLRFEHYRMEEQADASGEVYLYSYTWHISPDDYPTLTCRVCIGLKLTEHIQAEFVGYTLDDYDIQDCVRYVTASFEEHFDAENAETFTVNDSNMRIVPETEWTLNGMYNSFAYMDEYFTALLNKATETESTEKSRYHIK